jgi:hypothetical protein
MKMSKRVKQVYRLSLISITLFFIHILLNTFLDKQEWISLVFLAMSLFASIIALLYGTMEFSITKEPSDLWKVGFLGLLGLLGLIPGLSYGFFGLFGLFAFFGTRQYF